jgi:hypothetical protein
VGLGQNLERAPSAVRGRGRPAQARAPPPARHALHANSTRMHAVKFAVDPQKPTGRSGGHSRLRIITGARAGQFWQQDFSQNQQNFDLPGFWIDQQIDSQKDFSQNQQNFDLPGCWIDQQIDSQKYADFSLFRNH